MKPLVSILIPAYNSEQSIAQTLRSAVRQTWPRKEIIVVDDGSADRTALVAGTFRKDGVVVVSQRNEGAAAARNHAYRLSRGAYIQWLDADDLLSTNKIESQMALFGQSGSENRLMSCPWAYFIHRPHRARFIPTPLWCDRSPIDWQVEKFKGNLHQQTATWLTPRRLADAAGPWDARMLSDDDGEYFSRVLSVSSGTRFVPEARVYYRVSPPNRLSFIGNSAKKLEAMILSMELHRTYLLGLEDSERVRDAYRAYLQTWVAHFHPERPDIVEKVRGLAASVDRELALPSLPRVFAPIQRMFGLKAAKRLQSVTRHCRARAVSSLDRLLSLVDKPPSSLA